MVYRCFLLLSLLLIGLTGETQTEKTANRYSIGTTVAFGQSRPNWLKKAPGWGNGSYPAGRIGIHFDYALNEQWMLTGGLGIMLSGLSVKTPFDVYYLDFWSPQVDLGIAKIYPLSNEHHHLIAQLNIGLQKGFNHDLRDEFATYTVMITEGAPFYYFVRPELGWRIRTKRKTYGSLFNSSYAFGVFYRHQFNPLGRATFTSGDVEVVLAPPGSVVGIYGRWLLPVGKQRIPRKMQDEIPPNIIYHPRMHY